MATSLTLPSVDKAWLAAPVPRPPQPIRAILICRRRRHALPGQRQTADQAPPTSAAVEPLQKIAARSGKLLGPKRLA